MKNRFPSLLVAGGIAASLLLAGTAQAGDAQYYMQYGGSPKKIALIAVKTSKSGVDVVSNDLGPDNVAKRAPGDARYEPVTVTRACDGDNATVYDEAHQSPRPNQPAVLKIAILHDGKMFRMITLDHPVLESLSVSDATSAEEKAAGNKVCRLKFNFTRMSYDTKPGNKTMNDDWTQ